MLFGAGAVHAAIERQDVETSTRPIRRIIRTIFQGQDGATGVHSMPNDAPAGMTVPT